MEGCVTRKMLQAKQHRPRVTQARLNDEGSCGIDEQLLESPRIPPNPYIEIYSVSNGERFCTYVIRGRRSGEISLNGAAARRAAIRDSLISCAYSAYNQAQLASRKPIVVLMDK